MQPMTVTSPYEKCRVERNKKGGFEVYCISANNIKEFFNDHKNELCEYVIVGKDDKNSVEIYASGTAEDAYFLVEENGALAFVATAKSEDDIEPVYAYILERFLGVYSDVAYERDEVSSENRQEVLLEATYNYLCTILEEDPYYYLDDDCIEEIFDEISNVLFDRFGICVYHDEMEGV